MNFQIKVKMEKVGSELPIQDKKVKIGSLLPINEEIWYEKSNMIIKLMKGE